MNKIAIGVIALGIILTLAGIVILSNLEDDAIEAFDEGKIYEGVDGEMKITGENDTVPHLYVHIKSKFVGGKTGGYNERHGDNTWNLTQEDCDLVRNFTLTNDDSDQVFIPKCNYVEDIAGDDEWIVVGTLCKQWDDDELIGSGCPDGTYTWDSKGKEVMVYDGDMLGEAIAEVILSLLGSFGACCCGVVVLLIGIILAFTMEDTKATYENNQNSNLFNQAAAETGLKSTSGWDEKEDYIRKDATEEVEETKEEAPETDQRKGDYKIPPPE
ncbi:MAG TPA: hypothetical protein EYO80_01610 [Candidatus Marinimicrobia bacterium]|nr:hypothetical protein [Candidatus Neomarinimicrobiota bacterium]